MDNLPKKIPENSPFPCRNCGACCKYLHLVEELKELDRGDGVCIHLDEATNHCKIYATRPDICNIDTQYRLYYSDTPWEAFIAENLEVCDMLEHDQKQRKAALLWAKNNMPKTEFSKLERALNTPPKAY